MGMVKIMLRPFYNPNDGAEQAELVLWWEVLQPLADQEIHQATIEYQRSGPTSEKSKKLLRPSAGDIYKIGMKNRGIKLKKQPPKQKPVVRAEKPNVQKITDAQRAEMNETLSWFGKMSKRVN